MDRPRLLLLITALSLLLAFVWGSTGSSCLEAVHRWHRQEQQARMKGKYRDTLLLPYTEYLTLTAIDKKEIRYRGRMYDIGSVMRLGDHIRLAGHYDDLDHELFRMIDTFLGGHADASKELRRAAIFLFNGIIPEPPAVCSLGLAATRAGYGIPAIPALVSEVRDVIKGPPDGKAYC